MVSLFIFAATVVYLANGEKVIDGSINLKRHPGYGVAFANFIAHKFHYLDTSPLLTESVNELRECARLCVDHFSCFSFNGALVRDFKEKFLCQLLSSDKYNNSSHFVASQKFHHFSIKVGETITTLICNEVLQRHPLEKFNYSKVWIKTVSPAFSNVIIASTCQSSSVSILQLKIEVLTILRK